MPRPQKPWYWKKRKQWYVEIGGERHRLGPDKEDAMRKFHALMAEPPVKVKVGSVEELFVKFILFCKANRSAKTTRWYKDFLTSFSDMFPQLAMRELRPLHVQEWVDSHKDWSDSTKRGGIVSVQRACSWGLRMGMLQRNPVQFMDKPEVGKRERMISPKEYQEILGLVKDQEFRDYLETAWETAARPQEIRKVTADHVDLPNARWVFPVSEAKGKKKPRVVYLSDKALAITKRLIKLHPEGELFRSGRGAAWNASTTNCRFRRLKKKLGEKFCVYLFRHTRTTKALEAGLSTETVRELMGHQDGRMLEKHYSHLTQNPTFLREQVQKITASENEAVEKKKGGHSVAPARSKKKK